ncbi:hypothetical protein ACRAWD_07960 [Caulobacter segnis]
MATLKDYRLILIVPDRMARGEDILHLKAMGVDVHADPQRRRRGPSRILPGHGPEPGPVDPRRALRQPGSRTRPIRWPMRPTTRPRAAGADGRRHRQLLSSASARAAP